MTVTRCPQASQRDTCSWRLVPVPPACGWVQSRSERTRMCMDASIAGGPGSLALQECAAVRRLPATAAALVILALILPAQALGQGAGDEQYRDPFAGQEPGGQTQQQGGSTGQTAGDPAVAAQGTESTDP